MALYPPQEGKLIVAPATPQPQSQAPQFTLSTLHRSSLHPTSPIPQFLDWYTTARTTTTNKTSPPTPLIKAPETCVLSTASLPSGRVSSRVVYLKELDGPTGCFTIYSNFGTSRKAADLATNPHCSLVFWWEGLQRQVRVEGRARRMGREESQGYFDSRVRGSRVGAWASRQSCVLEPLGKGQGKEGAGLEGKGGEGKGEDDGRAMLEGWVKEVEKTFEDVERIPVPEFWGGLRIFPERVEFWQGRDNRLHDRFVYTLVDGEDGENGEDGEEGEEGEEGKEEKREHGGGKWKLERLSP